MADRETIEASETVPTWGDDAPRGGKAVLNRIMKEKATVPLFFAQTLINSLRDVGYNTTTSALCEHVDNSIQAGASEVRIYFRQHGKTGPLDTAVYDNGRGMAPSVLKVATAFGGSMNYGNRSGIARFGMGMKTAALSMSPVMELYSWQEKRAVYSMTLDVEAIGKERANLVELPDATMSSELPDELADLFRRPMSYPKQRNDQTILCDDGDDLYERLGSSGTIVFMQRCDRLTYAKSQTLVDHAVKEMSRVYRRAIAGGLRLYVNNRLVEAFDPTYAMAKARHAKVLDDVEPKHSRLIVTRTIDVRLAEAGEKTAPIQIRIFRLPIEQWARLPQKTLRNDLRVFEGLTVSILRNDREVFAGPMPKLTTRHSVTHWYRVQIDFPGELDEAFGVAANKQGVRMKGYVEEVIKEAVRGEITTLNDEIKRFQGEQAAARSPAKPSASEAKADEVDAFQASQLPAVSPEEQAQLDANLRGLALTLKRSEESDEQAFERIKASTHLIHFRHDEYWPFYEVRHKFGKVILTINTAHPFYTKLYEPLSKVKEFGADASDDDASAQPRDHQDSPIVALDLLLLSLARTHSRLAGANEDARKLLEALSREWSETYRVQLS